MINNTLWEILNYFQNTDQTFCMSASHSFEDFIKKFGSLPIFISNLLIHLQIQNETS